MIGFVGIFVAAAFCAQVYGSVYNGFVASSFEYPHVVVYGECAGSLISPQWVLSAAHCYAPYRTMLRILALPLLKGDVFIRKSVVHPKFKEGDNFNDKNGVTSETWAAYDYLLLQLEQPVLNVRPVSLWRGRAPGLGSRVRFPSLNAYKFFNDKVTRSGLYQGELFIMSDEECARRLRSYDPASMMCAVGAAPAHSSACHGDSGSGLVAGGRLLGIISWVEEEAIVCGADRIVVAARLSTSEIQEWIRNETRA